MLCLNYLAWRPGMSGIHYMPIKVHTSAIHMRDASSEHLWRSVGARGKFPFWKHSDDRVFLTQRVCKYSMRLVNPDSFDSLRQQLYSSEGTFTVILRRDYRDLLKDLSRTLKRPSVAGKVEHADSLMSSMPSLRMWSRSIFSRIIVRGDRGCQ